MDPLIAAALLDQERRILEASAREVMGNRRRRRQQDGPAGGDCKVCSSKLMAHNMSGFCSKTAACKAGQQRDWNQRNAERRQEIRQRTREKSAREIEEIRQKARAKNAPKPLPEDKGEFFPVVSMPDGGFSLTARGVACGPEEHKARKG